MDNFVDFVGLNYAFTGSLLSVINTRLSSDTGRNVFLCDLM